jgi:hypothetical protein
MRFIGWLFGADTSPAPDATKLDGRTEVTLARSLSALPPSERGWITFAEACSLFSTKGAEYAFGETDDDGRRKIETFAALHRSVVNFMPVEGRVYFALIQPCDEYCGGKRRAVIGSLNKEASDGLPPEASVLVLRQLDGGGRQHPLSLFRPRPQSSEFLSWTDQGGGIFSAL